MKTIRFWHWDQAPVQITIGEGECLRHHRSTPTDEGWSRSTDTWTFEDDTLTWVSESSGRDCDGPHFYSMTSICPASQLRAGIQDDGVAYPQWTDKHHEQRDAYAEGMNY
jgi:hypothetical protein